LERKLLGRVLIVEMMASLRSHTAMKTAADELVRAVYLHMGHTTSIHNAHLIFTISSHSPGIVVLMGVYQPVEGAEMAVDTNIRVRLATGEPA
jgi:hypothetical protein